MPFYAGIDLGATKLRVAVADADGAIVAAGTWPTPTDSAGEQVVDAVLDALTSVCDDAGVDPPRIHGVGIGSIGPLDLAEGSITEGVNLPIDGPIRLRDPIAGLVDGPVHLWNDAAAGVIGERASGDTPDDIVYLTISTGIGAGVAVDGHVLCGRDGNAGEVGHIVVEPDGHPCGCGQPGHWEAYCSGSAIPRLAWTLAADEALQTDLPLDAPEFDAGDVFAAATDPLAERVIDIVARYNAIGVADLVHAYAPSLVSIGGAVALRNEERVIDPIRDRLPGLVMTDAPTVRSATLGEEAVLRGAIKIATEHKSGAMG